MGTPNIQRSRIRKARHFIFFPVYESLFLQACIRITRVPLKSFVRKVMWQWLASVGVKRVDKIVQIILQKNQSRHILSRNPFIFVEKSTTHDTR